MHTVGPLRTRVLPPASPTLCHQHWPSLAESQPTPHSFKELKGCWRANSPTGYMSGTEALGGGTQATLQTVLAPWGWAPAPRRLLDPRAGRSTCRALVGLPARPGSAECPSDLAAARSSGGVCRVRGSPCAQGALARPEAVGRMLDACVACPVLSPPPRTPRRARKSGPASTAARSQGSRVSEEPLAPSVIQLTFFKGPGTGRCSSYEHSFWGLALRGRTGVLGDPA